MDFYTTFTTFVCRGEWDSNLSSDFYFKAYCVRVNGDHQFLINDECR